MLEEKNKKEIEKIAKDFFSKISKNEKPDLIKIEDNLVSIEFNTESPELFIGKHGSILSDIQYLLAKILRKKVDIDIFVDLDINEYKKNKLSYLKDLAKDLADEVSLNKKEKILPPMSSYERRAIHLALSERKDIKTESIGEEPERRMIIKPV